MRTALAALAVLGATVVPAYADHDRFLTVSGDGTGYVDVTLAEDTMLDPRYVRIQATGRVAGLYVRPLAGSGREFVLITVRDSERIALSPGELPAGRYRVHLVADRRASVRVLARGLRHNIAERVRHRRPLTVNAGRLDVREDSPGRYRGQMATSVRGRGSIVWTAFREHYDDAPVRGWGGVEDCFERPGEPCDDTLKGYVPMGRVDLTSPGGWTRHEITPQQPGAVLRQTYYGTAKPREVRVLAVEVVLS